MSGFPVIGTVKGAYTSTSRQQSYTIDQPRFCAILIPQDGSGAYLINDIESFETKKSANGEAGTWRFTMPLLAAAQLPNDSESLAGNISPMDMVAIYASRNSTDQNGAQVPGTWLTLGPPVSLLTYGNIATTTLLGQDYQSCLMIGFVDGHEESQSEDSASATLEVWGRDLTKILIENDAAVPSMDTQDGIGAFFLQVSNIVINNATSGWALLEQVLDAFVAKNPQTLAHATGESVSAFQAISKYGYPWRNFILTNLEDLNFRSIPQNVKAIYPANSGGSAWANLVALKNEPLTRLYVDEIGQLTFDDAFSAWGFGVDPIVSPPTMPIVTRDNIRERKFSRNDADLITAIGIMNHNLTGASVAIANALQAGAIQTNEASLVAKYGFRYLEFTAEWVAPDAQASFMEATILPVLLAMHNDLWTAEITVKGDPRYRVGYRVTLAGIDVAHSDLSLMRTPRGMTWYITDVEHNGQYGSDYSTKLTLRFSSASLSPPIQVSGEPTLVT
jgi:hypothetical protein